MGGRRSFLGPIWPMVPHESWDDIVSLGPHGVLQWATETEYVQEIKAHDLGAFKDEKKDSAGDLRRVGDHRDSEGRRFLSLNDSVNLMRQSTFEDWPFSGPRATRDYLKAVLSGPGDMMTYHLNWVRNSGVHQSSAIVHEHKAFVEVIRLAVSRDQIDISNLCSFEAITRRLGTLEMAVARNPGMPDFTGLEVISESPISNQGQAYVSSIASWATERLKEKASIQKQSRLFKEEFSKSKGKKQETEEEGPGKRWRPGKKKKQGADGGGAEGSAAGS